MTTPRKCFANLLPVLPDWVICVFSTCRLSPFSVFSKAVTRRSYFFLHLLRGKEVTVMQAENIYHLSQFAKTAGLRGDWKP